MRADRVIAGALLASLLSAPAPGSEMEINLIGHDGVVFSLFLDGPGPRVIDREGMLPADTYVLRATAHASVGDGSAASAEYELSLEIGDGDDATLGTIGFASVVAAYVLEGKDTVSDQQAVLIHLNRTWAGEASVGAPDVVGVRSTIEYEVLGDAEQNFVSTLNVSARTAADIRVDGVATGLASVSDVPFEVPSLTTYRLRVTLLLSCPSDVDGDGGVGRDDVAAVLAAWGPCPPECPEDVDGDGAVGFSDVLRMLRVWGPCF